MPQNKEYVQFLCFEALKSPNVAICSETNIKLLVYSYCYTDILIQQLNILFSILKFC